MLANWRLDGENFSRLADLIVDLTMFSIDEILLGSLTALTMGFVVNCALRLILSVMSVDDAGATCDGSILWDIIHRAVNAT